MQKSKLIETLQCLEIGEMHRLGLFLEAAYFHTEPLEPPVLLLFEYIRKYFGTWEHPYLHRDAVYAQLFTDTPIIKGRLEKVMTRLLREVRRFIVLEMQRKQTDSHEEYLQLARFFDERRNFDEFERHIAAARTALEEETNKDSKYFFKAFQLEESMTTHLAWFNDRKTDFNLDHTLHNLQAHFVGVQLDYWTLHLYQARAVPVEQPKYLSEHALMEQLVAALPLQQLPSIWVNYKAYLLLRSQLANPQLFKDFTDSLDTYKHDLPPEKYKNYLTLARSYCIQEYNKGNKAFFQITFDMYREHLEKGYLYRNGTIHAAILKNLVSMGLRMGQYPWTVELLERHRQCIAGVANPEDVYKFNLAVCHFHQAEYTAVLDLLSFNYEELFYKLAAKRLEIKALHEIKSPILDARLDAFNILIFRIGGKQISDTYTLSNKHFGAFLKRIVNPGTLHNAKRRQKLKTEIAQTATVVEKEWLLEILER